MSALEFLFLLLLGAAALVRVADAIRVPYPIVLVLGGLAIGLVPSLPEVRLDPHVLFLVFLPPLLASAGFYASPQALRTEARPLAFLVLGTVALTTVAVAVVAHLAVSGLSWAESFVLGAVVAPTDPLAASATFARVGVPDRVRLLVEGEAMLNDATALVLYRVALGAVASGAFSAGDAALDIAKTASGGIAVGLAVGWVERRALRRLDDRALAILITLLVPYAAYIGAEEIGVSGVLAAVMAGLYLGWHAHEAFDADTRLSSIAFWEVLVFGLNAAVFVLLGLQLPHLLDRVQGALDLGSLTAAALLVSLTVVVLRIAMQFLPGAGTGEDWRERLVVGWSGMRGAISLAAALAVPFAVDGRPQILFCAVVVILVTLVGQGLTLAPLIRLLRIPPARAWSPDEAVARLEAAQAALDRLDELEDEGATEEQLRRLRELYRARFRACQAAIAGDPEAQAHAREPVVRYGALRRELIGVERAVLLELRGAGRLPLDVERLIERDLDLEEARLRA